MNDPAPDLGQFQQWRAVASLGWLALLLAWETAAPFLPEFPRLRDRLRHGVRNYAIALLNAVVAGLGFALAWKAVAGWADAHRFGLLHWIPLPTAAQAVGAVLLFDLWTYLWHRAAHRLPHLWMFHRMHHSDPRMDVTTANRFHVVEIGISSVLRIGLIPLLGLQFWHVVLYETLLQVLVQLQHANVALPGPVERVMRWVFVTPDMHKIHHSRWQPETDSNYASLFSFWDRIFGTYRMRPDPENVVFGLDGYDDDRHQSVAGLLRTPFREPDVPTPPASPTSPAP